MPSSLPVDCDKSRGAANTGNMIEDHPPPKDAAGGVAAVGVAVAVVSSAVPLRDISVATSWCSVCLACAGGCCNDGGNGCKCIDMGRRRSGDGCDGDVGMTGNASGNGDGECNSADGVMIGGSGAGASIWDDDGVGAAEFGDMIVADLPAMGFGSSTMPASW